MQPASDSRQRRQRGSAIVAPPSSRASARAVAITASEGTRAPVAIARLTELARDVLAAEKVRNAMISIALVSSREIAALNRKHLGHKGPTDVITFAMGSDPTGVVVADIYICPDVAREQARDHGVGIREEMARLVVHGVLHACGYEHPEEDRTTSPMWRRQEALLKRLWSSRQQPA